MMEKRVKFSPLKDSFLNGVPPKIGFSHTNFRDNASSIFSCSCVCVRVFWAITPPPKQHFSRKKSPPSPPTIITQNQPSSQRESHFPLLGPLIWPDPFSRERGRRGIHLFFRPRPYTFFFLSFREKKGGWMAHSLTRTHPLFAKKAVAFFRGKQLNFRKGKLTPKWESNGQILHTFLGKL